MTATPGPSADARLMRRNVRWNLLGNVVYAVGQWLQLAVLARLGGPAAVGAYAFALALTAPIMMFGYLQIGTLLATDAARRYAFPEYRRLRVATTAASLLAIALVATATRDGRRFWAVLAPVCAMRAADAVTDIYNSLWQRSERMSVIGLGLVLRSTASLAFMIAAALLGGGPPAAATGAALGSCAGLAFVLLRTRADPELAEDLGPPGAPVPWRRLARLAAEAAPLGLIVLLGSLQANVPRYFVQLHAGEAELGLFAAASQLTSAGAIVVGALGSAALPRLGRLRAEGAPAQFQALVTRLALVGAALGVAGFGLSVALGRPVLVALFRPEFAAAAGTLVVLSGAAGLGFVATLLGYALTAARAIAVQPVLLAAALAAAAVACVLLVPRQGALGAAWALVGASAVQAACAAAAVARVRPGRDGAAETVGSPS